MHAPGLTTALTQCRGRRAALWGGYSRPSAGGVCGRQALCSFHRLTAVPTRRKPQKEVRKVRPQRRRASLGREQIDAKAVWVVVVGGSKIMAAKGVRLALHIPVLLLLVLHRHCVAAQAGEVAVLDVKRMQALLRTSEVVILLLHLGECKRTEEFSSTLSTLAQHVSVPVGRIDVKQDRSSEWTAAFKQGTPADIASGIMQDLPVLKAHFRSAPSRQRIQQYRGPPTLRATLAWAKAVASWTGHDFGELASWLDGAVASQQDDLDGPETPDTPVPAPSHRWAGREGAFNGPSIDDAYHHMMGAETKRATKDSGAAAAATEKQEL